MAWAIPNLRIETVEELKDKLTAALDEAEGEDDAKDRLTQLTAARPAIEKLIKSGRAGEGPWLVSVGAHPDVGASGSRPYISISIIGTAKPEPTVKEA